MDQSFTDSGPNSDDQTRPSVGIRPILHAALIFDPDFVPPPPTIYRLPRRPKPLPRLTVESKEEPTTLADAIEDHRGHEGRGAGTAQSPKDVSEESKNTLQQLFDDLFGDQPTPNNSIRWNTLSHQDKIPPHDQTTSNINGGDSPQAYLNSPDTRSTNTYNSSYNSTTASTTPSSSESQQCAPQAARLKVTDEELKPESSQSLPQVGLLNVTDEELQLLDYDGTRGRQGNDALYNCTARAASVDREEDEERVFEIAFRSLRWSM